MDIEFRSLKDDQTQFIPEYDVKLQYPICRAKQQCASYFLLAETATCIGSFVCGCRMQYLQGNELIISTSTLLSLGIFQV